MANETIDLDPAALRSAGNAFKEKATAIENLANQFDGLLAEVSEASKVEGVEMIAMKNMLDAFHEVVGKVKEDLLAIAGNSSAFGNAFINQANGTQDADLDTTGRVNSAGEQA